MEINVSEGMAVKLFCELTGMENLSFDADQLTYEELREQAWEDRGEFDWIESDEPKS